MKKLFLRTLFFLIPFLYSIYVCSQPANNKDCSTTCFSSEVVSVEEVSSSCKTYELKVSFTGKCAHALSHYSVAVPCGKITALSNSENWPQEIGTDPTTQLSGFKIDEIQGFGEGATSSFNVKFTICDAGESCAEQLKCWQPVVAYKAATCVNYETLTVSCKALKASLEKQDATCFGVADGSISVTVAEGQEPYTFLWSDNSTAQSRQALKAGDYSVVVKDASGAEVTLSATIREPEQISIEGTVSPASCNGKADGAIDVNILGGNAPYLFTWNNDSDTEDLTGVSAGQYFLTVSDNNNCSATARFTVPNMSAFNLTVGLTAPDCNSANGLIDLGVTGGIAPYSFEWSNGALTEDLNNVAAGLYSVTVTDNAGCSAERSVFLKENNTLNVKGVSTPTSCTGEATGSIDLTVSGGATPYTYTWSHGATTEDLSNVGSGYYSVTVEDSKGCVVTASFTVTKKTFDLPRTVVQPTCDGEANGSITLLEPIGGTAPYSYEWSNGETGTTLDNLAPGAYSVTVTDATGCTKTLSLNISAPAPIVATAVVSSNACSQDGSYAIDLFISGGTPPYTYQWSNGASTQDIDGLSAGSYAVVITDAKGCTISKEVIIEPVTPLSCTIEEPGAAPICGSINNTLSSSISDADSYAWSVQSSDNSWTITSTANGSMNYTAGTEGSHATFTLTITRDGCTQSCTYTTDTCVPDPSAEEPGGEEPGEEEPGDEEPGEEEPGDEEPGEEEPGDEEPGDSETCEECFNTVANLISSSGECRTYEITISTNGLCAHDLSHWTMAIPCGNISDYSNSRGWKMELGKDPTTGLYGFKVDDISDFGKRDDSFTVRFTLCAADCDLDTWTPVVGYKAGQCVATEGIQIERSLATTTSVAVYPNPFNDVVHFQWEAVQPQASLEIIDQYGNIVMRSTTPETDGKHASLDVDSSSLPKGMYYYRLAIDGKVYNGKLSKR